MMESDEDIAFTLDLAGEGLDFSGTLIKGIPGHSVYNIPSYDSPYDIKKQEFDFQIAFTDFVTLGLTKGSTFTYTMRTKIYSFTVVDYADDLIGWIELSVNFTGAVNA